MTWMKGMRGQYGGSCTNGCGVHVQGGQAEMKYACFLARSTVHSIKAAQSASIEFEGSRNTDGSWNKNVDVQKAEVQWWFFKVQNEWKFTGELQVPSEFGHRIAMKLTCTCWKKSRCESRFCMKQCG